MKYLMFICCLFFASNTIAETPQNLIDFINQYKGSYNHPLFSNSEGKMIDDLDGVNKLIEQVTTEINSGSTDPRIHWLRPYLKTMWLVMYTKFHDPELNKLFGDDYDAHPIVSKIKAERIPDYEKALQLNKTASADEKLNFDMISKIYINRALPAHILEMASREHLAFIRQQDSIENEREFYQQFYFDLINVYIRDKDYDSALRILKEFDGVQGGVLEENLPVLEAHKAKWALEAAQETELAEQEDATQETEIKKTETVTTADKQQPVVKTEDTQQNYEDFLEADNNKAIIIGIVLAVLLLVGFVAVKRKKK